MPVHIPTYNSNYPQHHLTNSKELFNNCMGKEYSPASNNATEHVVYNLFKNSEKPKQNCNFDFKINNLHVLNQLAILTHSRNLALANNHIDIANQLDEKIALIEKKVTLAAPATFNPMLEDKSLYTALKIAGLIAFSGLAAITLKSMFDGFHGPSLPANENNKACFELNNNNIEVLLQAGNGNVTAYNLLNQIQNCPIPLDIIKNNHLIGIQKETLLGYGTVTFHNYIINIPNNLNNKVIMADYFDKLLSENDINSMMDNKLEYEEVLKEFEDSNKPTSSNIRKKYNENLENVISVLTKEAIKSSLNSMNVLEKLNTQSPISDIEQTRVLFKEAFAKQAAEKENKIKMDTQKAILGNSYAMDRLEQLNTKSPVLDIEQTRIAFNEAVAKENAKQAVERESEISNDTPKAITGDSLAMDSLEQLNKKSPVSGIEQIREKYNAAIAIKVAGDTSKAILGDLNAMNRLEQLNNQSPIPGIEKTRIAYNEASAEELENEVKIYVERATKNDEHTAGFWMKKLKVIHDKSPIQNYEEILNSYHVHSSKNNHVEKLTEKAIRGDSSCMNSIEQYNEVSPVSGIEQIREKFNTATRRINIEKYTNEAKTGSKLAYIKLKAMHKESPIQDFELTRELYEKARDQKEKA